jgi:hypothetical protein
MSGFNPRRDVLTSFSAVLRSMFGRLALARPTVLTDAQLERPEQFLLHREHTVSALQSRPLNATKRNNRRSF